MIVRTTKKERYMRFLMKLSIAAFLIGMETTAFSSDNYEDLVAGGYRWVNVDGPYASKLLNSGNFGHLMKATKK
jgi:hypothetical protein